MKRFFVICLTALLSLGAFAQAVTGNPFASKGELVAPVVHSQAVGDVIVNSPDAGLWKFNVALESLEAGKELVTITMDASSECMPPKFNVYFSFPQKGVFNLWSAKGDCLTHLDPFWENPNHKSSLARTMPLYEYFDDNETNRLTIALSEPFRLVNAKLGLFEESCEICSEFNFFTEIDVPQSHYEVKILLDSRPVFWAESIREGAEWIMDVAGLKQFQVPEAAFEPLYSTWYQFHQNVTAEAVEAECRLAADMGMKVVILDDGWQTEDGNRGYAFCGDWRPTPVKFPDMAAHVAKVHETGMKYMVWYSVPYVGTNSDACAKFAGKFLRFSSSHQAYILDPRFPEVREYLVSTYENAMRDWDLDGFKLDFIDAFKFDGVDPAVAENYAGRDIRNLSEAIDVLMKEVSARLCAIKPDVLIEFRQDYMGPAIRQYGNMIRACDCPGNAKDNRMRIASLRLTSGLSAVHADMLEWHPSETPENVGRTLISCVFGVIQYSMMLDKLPEEHKAVVRRWMDFARDHRETLLHSDFRPHHPELQYPVIEAESDAERIIAVFQDNAVVELGAGAGARTRAGVALAKGKPVYILNASGCETVAVRYPGGKIRSVKVPCGDYKKL